MILRDGRALELIRQDRALEPGVFSERDVMKAEIHRAVADAVDVVNQKPGLTCVKLRFADDLSEIDFVANAAQFDSGRFEFQAGFETYGGSVDELADIHAEVIRQ
ncbi:MAG: hypothetical protein AMXMBFR47_11120 [Planctomycetota bacterium]